MLRFQISLVLFIINGTAKTKVAILPFLCCRDFAKTSFVSPLYSLFHLLFSMPLLYHPCVAACDDTLKRKSVSH